MTNEEKLKEILPSFNADLLKKFNQLKALDMDNRVLIISGLVDGLMNNTIPYPNGSLIPPVRLSMDVNYCAGFEVGETWAKIANLNTTI